MPPPDTAEAVAPAGSQGEQVESAAVVDGTVAVRDGQLIISDPSSDGLPAVVIPGDDVVLTLDGHEVTRPVSVWSGQNVQVRPRRPSRPVRGFRLKVAPDRMSAYLLVEEQGPPGYRIADAGPAHVITLVSEPLPGLQANPGEEELERAMWAAGIVMGVDCGAALRAFARPEAQTVRVASGKPATQGVPGRVESLLLDESLDAHASLGLRAEPGQVLARLTPAEPGEAGHDVLGNSLEPDPIPSLTLVAGHGALLSQDGTEALASLYGRPVLLEVEPGVYRASVVPVAEYYGLPQTGDEPHRFEGDVVIHGDLNGVAVSAGGWIWVRGAVQGASLVAGQGIWVERGVQWSHLTTRATRKRLVQFHQHYAAIVSDLRRLRHYATMIIDHPRYQELARVRSLGEVMLFLTRQRFSALDQRIHRARQTLADLTELRAYVDLEAILNALECRLYSGGMESVDDLEEFIDTLKTAVQRAEDILGAGGVDAPVCARVIIGSEVSADGDVTIHGSGAERSTVRAKGLIQVPSLRDVLATSATGIETETAVAITPGSLRLEVYPGGYIRIGLALQNVEVKVGNWSRVVAPESRNVLIQSDVGDQVRVTSYPDNRRKPPTVLPPAEQYGSPATQAG